MRFNFMISDYGQGAEKAKELKEKLEDLMKHYGMEGKCDGMNSDNFASYHGSYSHVGNTPSKNDDKGKQYFNNWSQYQGKHHKTNECSK